MQSATEGWLPIANPPVGLVTWYAPDGTAMALVTSWLGVIAGQPPELRAGCCGRPPHAAQFPAGIGFAVNIPARMDLPVLRDLVRPGIAGCAVVVAGAQLAPARCARAPLLAGCVLQIECAGGRVLPRDWEPELAGEILVVHRGGHTIEPAASPDFCTLFPLRADCPG